MCCVQLPILDEDGEVISHEDVVEELERDTVSYSNAVGFGQSMNFLCGAFSQLVGFTMKFEVYIPSTTNTLLPLLPLLPPLLLLLPQFVQHSYHSTSRSCVCVFMCVCLNGRLINTKMECNGCKTFFGILNSLLID